MNEVFRRILVVAMVAVGALVALSCFVFGVFMIGAGFVGFAEGSYNLDAKTITQYISGGLALAIIPNIAIAYIALGYFKKPDSNAD